MKELTERKQSTNTPWYKKATLPWAVIVISTALLIGVITGWTLRSNEQDHIQARAADMLTSLSKPQGR